MIPLLTRAQMVALDRHTIEHIGIPALVLMEQAGRSVADVAEALQQADGRPVLAVAGTGNNGADAVVAARHLAERGRPASILVLGSQDRLTDDAAVQIRIAERLNMDVTFAEGDGGVRRLVERLEGCGTVVDGLFGTGLGRPVEGWRRTAIEAIAARDDLGVVAVDLPSGVDADTGRVLGVAVRADATVAFQYPKVGHALFPGRALSGALTIADIGIPPSQLPKVSSRYYIVSVARLREAFVPRAADGHKGTYGHLLVVAGVPDRPGAALLAGRAAHRCGTGLVTVGSDQETIRRVAGALETIMGLSLGMHRVEAGAVLEAVASRTALAIGPSLPADPRTAELLRAVLDGSRVPAVVDAGALSALGTDVDWLKRRGAPVVLTPHPGEMARLTGVDAAAVQRDRLRVALSVADRTGAHVVLKGASTVVAHPDGRAGVVVAGNAGMASGGTGDVLTGVIGALLAQGVAPDVAAEAGALAHAMAGDRAAELRGEAGLIATDLLFALTEVVKKRVEDAED